jgi:hypothetical protein
MKDRLQVYAGLGFSIFPCNPDKTPAVLHGFKNATNDIDAINHLFNRDDMLIGFPTGRINGFVVVDLDVKDGHTVDGLKEALLEYGPLPETVEVETMSGGRHLYYYAPETNLSSSTRFFHKALPIDIRGNNGYVIAPGSKGYDFYDDFDGLDIELLKTAAPLPEWIETYKRPASEIVCENYVPLTDIEKRDIRSALNFIDPDDRDQWVRIGHALKSTGDPAAKGLWLEYSQRSDKFDAKDSERKWKSFKPSEITMSSIFYDAKKNGWISTNSREIIVHPPSTSGKSSVILNDKATLEKSERKKFPDHLLKPAGLVGDIMQYIVETSIRPQPVFALAGALCAVATLAGQKYQTPTGLRTNIYCLSVGPSGCGKESPRQAIKRLFSMAGCDRYLGVEAIASDASIVSELKEHPSRLFMLDEIGRFLRTTTSATKSTYLYNVVTTLLSIHGASESVFYGKSYADSTKKIKLDQPNLCIYGTTVPDSLYDGMVIENITDGFLARFMVFETDIARPGKRKISNVKLSHSKPIEIIDQIKYLDSVSINCDPQGNVDSVNPNPRVVEFSDEALHIVNNFDQYIEDLRQYMEDNDNKLEAIYNRTSAIAMQIALILAIGENIESPIISAENMEYGAALALHLAEHMVYIADNFIAKNDLEHEVKKILNLILQKGQMSISEITRKTQHLQGHQRADVLNTLVMSDQVASDYIDGSGNKKIMWFFDKSKYPEN